MAVPDYPPAGKTAIVTGGSSGIGLSTAIELGKAGWNVVVTGRRIEQLQEAVEAVEKAGGRKGSAAFVAGDVSDEAVVKRIFEKAQQQYNRVDLIFCNAGITTPAKPLQEVTLSEFQQAVSTNLTASFLCGREAFRVMAAQSPPGGRIIMNGSISAHVPRPDSTPYTATKHGVSGLTKCFSLDGRKYNIAVSQIDIGNAASEMTTRMREGPGVQQANGTFSHEPVFDRTFAAREVVHIAEMPLSVNVQFVTIQATNMPSMIGRG